MKKMNIAMAVTIALAACVNTGLLAAEKGAATADHQPKTGSQGTNSTLATGWYGPGWDGGFGYFNPQSSSEYNPYPYYNIVGGEEYGPLYEADLPDQYESPFNPPMALTRHGLSAQQPANRPSPALRKHPAQAVPPGIVPGAP